jgi:hypothetical protein
MEVENLERALNYRAELRVTAYQILNQLGIASEAEELAVTKILGYLSGIKVVGKPLEVREFEQLTSASTGTRRRLLPSSGRRRRR